MQLLWEFQLVIFETEQTFLFTYEKQISTVWRSLLFVYVLFIGKNCAKVKIVQCTVSFLTYSETVL
jgi:hypothetical protein